LRANFLGLFLASGGVAQLILVGLFFASVGTWAIILTKWFQMRYAMRQDHQFSRYFWSGKTMHELQGLAASLPFSPCAKVFRFAMGELKNLSGFDAHIKIELINRAISRESVWQIAQLQKHTSILASVASSGPFVGLFGTVWGIMNAFQSIGTNQSASLAVVAPGISEALITTAVGLAAAIPAVLGYNYCSSKSQTVSIGLECFSQDLLNFLQRSLTDQKG
jgi:biopolymer transport protein TolQ